MSINSYKKFDKYGGKKYMEAYIKKFTNFYSKIEDIMGEYLIKNEKLIGLDLGAGPGIGALLLDKQKINCTLYGLEPSKTSEEGSKFANQLKKDGSSVCYKAKRGVIQDLEKEFEIKEESLDFILILRTIHEIRESVGGEIELKSQLKDIAKLLKKNGILIVADPQYNQKINSNPEKYREIINEMKILQKKTIGHSHEPKDYIPLEKLKEYFPEYETLEECKIEIKIFSNKIQISSDKNIDIKPMEFYVVVFEKQ
jgi:SAM-dependent methyltransferase